MEPYAGWVSFFAIPALERKYEARIQVLENRVFDLEEKAAKEEKK